MFLQVHSISCTVNVMPKYIFLNYFKAVGSSIFYSDMISRGFYVAACDSCEYLLLINIIVNLF